MHLVIFNSFSNDRYLLWSDSDCNLQLLSQTEKSIILYTLKSIFNINECSKCAF